VKRARRSAQREGLVPISIADYLVLHLKSNPKENRSALETALRASLAAALRGECCECGEPIWALGSAIVGRGCFTCITGDASPSGDYEITTTR